ncbi:MAG: Mov34/MPN/PAD-1 family protein [Methanobacteriota archaeon]
MQLLLPSDLLERIRHHAVETYPHECCGFLLGTMTKEAWAVAATGRAANAREDSPENRYLIRPEEFLAAETEAEARGLAVVGFYHSHPGAPARPSEFDRAHAWPGYAYLIVSVTHGAAREANAFVLADDRKSFFLVEMKER